MKPKLIILNGPLGIGKSTLAKKYAVNHPLTLCLDIDQVWSMVSHWREQKDKTASLSKQMALSMARINLKAKNDVIVPQIIQTKELRESFTSLAQECDADFYEILLYVEKDEAIKRYKQRAKVAGYETGFRLGGIIDTNGREEKLTEMYENMIEAARSNQNIIYLEPRYEDVTSTYEEILKRTS